MGNKPFPDGTWDQGLDFDEEAKRLRDSYSSADLNPQERAYIAALLIQLYNGLRVSEAAEAYNRFVQIGLREIDDVRVRKLPVVAGQPAEVRKAMVPEFIQRYPDTISSPEALGMFAKRRFGYRTHSLRYAYLTYLGVKKKVPIQVIAKITHHRRLDQLITYVQRKEADRVQGEVVDSAMDGAAGIKDGLPQ